MSLDALIEAVEAGTLTAFECGKYGVAISPHCNGETITLLTALDAFNGSLDAALALHEALLPGWTVRMISHGQEYADIGIWNVKVNWEHISYQPTFTAAGPFGYEGQSNTHARAWLLAILRAYKQVQANG